MSLSGRLAVAARQWQYTSHPTPEALTSLWTIRPLGFFAAGRRTRLHEYSTGSASAAALHKWKTAPPVEGTNRQLTAAEQLAFRTLSCSHGNLQTGFHSISDSFSFRDDSTHSGCQSSRSTTARHNPARISLPSSHGTSQSRSYAKAGVVPKGIAAGPEANHSYVVDISSPNQIVEPYTGSPVAKPFVYQWLTVAGWKERWAQMKSSAQSLWAIRICKKHVKGFNIDSYKEGSVRIYIEVCESLAANKISSLRQAVTYGLLSELKKELRQRDAARWHRVEWRLAEQPNIKNDINVCHGRIIHINPKDDTSAFVQLTTRLETRQFFAAYDKKGNLVAGNPSEAIPVTDLWVFERSMKDNISNRWRVAARLDATLR